MCHIFFFPFILWYNLNLQLIKRFIRYEFLCNINLIYFSESPYANQSCAIFTTYITKIITRVRLKCNRRSPSRRAGAGGELEFVVSFGVVPVPNVDGAVAFHGAWHGGAAVAGRCFSGCSEPLFVSSEQRFASLPVSASTKRSGGVLRSCTRQGLDIRDIAVLCLCRWCLVDIFDRRCVGTGGLYSRYRAVRGRPNTRVSRLTFLHPFWIFLYLRSLYLHRTTLYTFRKGV